MAAKSFTILVEAFNYKFPPKPYETYLHCDSARPIGVRWVSSWNQCMELVRKRLFLIQYGLDVIGTDQITSMDDYYDFIAGDCSCCAQPVSCELVIDDCFLFINGCTINIP